MKLDKDYKVPEGFHPVLNYPEGMIGEEGVPIAGLASLRIGKHRCLTFRIENGYPALPLLVHGEIQHVGWDIPTRYAIDGDRGCWMDNAHGHALMPVEKEELLQLACNELRNDEDIERLHKILGVTPPEPGWMKEARAAGWRPPKEET